MTRLLHVNKEPAQFVRGYDVLGGKVAVLWVQHIGHLRGLHVVGSVNVSLPVGSCPWKDRVLWL